jgi:hypothetical protein
MSYSYEYKVLPSAEAVDRRLSLIDENKNLLEYPYEKALPLGFTDVGDGSILTSGAYSQQSFDLNACTLDAGKYIISLTITNITEEPTIVSDFSLKVRYGTTNEDILAELTPSNDGKKTFATFTLSMESTVIVSLEVPNNVITGLLIKPQLEKYTADGQPSGWVPNMDKIGTYVDRRFNGTNAKIKVLTDTKAEKVHTHKYAESDSAGGAATSANKVNNSLIVTLGDNSFTFDGSTEESIDITTEAIGAAEEKHQHASNEINVMTGYSKADAVEAISAGDTLNKALGKLEKALEQIGLFDDNSTLLALLNCIEIE